MELIEMASTAKTWFITGSSVGFGRIMTEQLLADGHNVVATARKPETLAELATQYPDTLLTAHLDVTQKESITSAVDQALQKFPTIDVLVNNAGYGQVGAIEELTEQEIQTQFNTNVLGLIQVTQAILPTMRAQKAGHILNLSSIAGLMGFPGFGIYCASKFAVEAISEAMSTELQPYNIKVTLIEPGAFRTRFANSQSISSPANRLEAYDHITPGILEWLQDVDNQQAGDPNLAVTEMIKITTLAEPPLRLLLGRDAWDNAQKKINLLNQDFNTYKHITNACNYPDATPPKAPHRSD